MTPTRPSGVRASVVASKRAQQKREPNSVGRGEAVQRLEGRTLMSVSLDAGGWTAVGPSSDTQVIYVSSSGGNDANDGRTAPVKTIARGRSLLRSGMPDHMLLKRGDVWQESLHGGAAWAKSGRDADEPMLIGTYGDAAAARPVLQTGTGTAFDLNGKAVHDLVIKGLHFHAHTRDPDAATYTGTAAGNVGLRIVGAPQRLTLEDNQVEAYQQNVTISDYNGRPADVKVRRNVIVDAYPTAAGGKSQGLYVTNTDRITLEGNLFDHNGWDERVSFAKANQYNHNVYMQQANTGVVVRDNVFANASSHGLQARSGGEIRNNLFLRNAVGMSFGFVNGGAVAAGGVAGSIDGNVFLDSHDIGGVARGWGVEINNTRAGANVGIRNNVFAHDTRGTNAAIRLDTGAGISNLSDAVGINDLTVEDNIAYKWHQGFYTAGGFVNGGSGLTGYKDVTVRNNDFQQIMATRMVRHEQALDTAQEKWSGNRYADSDLPSSNWFQIGSSMKSIEAWRSIAEPTAQSAAGAYADPGRTISTYNASLGGTGSLNGYLAQARQQRQGSFRGAYSAAAAINYVRKGFAEGGVVPGGELPVSSGGGGTVTPAPAPVVDTVAPVVASYAAGGITAAGGTAHTFTVTYRDDKAISAASVGGGDVLVTGPGAYSQPAALARSVPSADGLSVVATYSVPAPGGVWDAPDNGTYTLALRAAEVKDAAGNAAPAATVGTFGVNVALATPTPSPTPSPTPATVLRAVADAYVRDGTYAGTNYGAAPELVVKKSGSAGNSREAYLRFDLSSVATVTSAKLRLFGRLNGTVDPSVTTTVYSASNTTWTEGALAWNGKPAADATSRGAIAVSGTTGKWYELDLTSFLKAEKAAGRNQVTLVLKNGAVSDPQTLFASDEAAANRPELVLA